MKLRKYTYFVCSCWFYSHSETRDMLKHHEISNSHNETRDILKRHEISNSHGETRDILSVMKFQILTVKHATY
jgi:hypothetical protein